MGSIIAGVLKIGEIFFKRALDADQLEKIENLRRDKAEALAIDAAEKYILENLQPSPNNKLLRKYQKLFFKYNQAKHV